MLLGLINSRGPLNLWLKLALLGYAGGGGSRFKMTDSAYRLR